jgi:hypothetical protein
MHSHLFAKSVRCAAIAICASIFLGGCTAQDLQQLQQARTQAVATLDQAQTAQSQIQKQLTTLPASDPARQQLEPKLEKLDALITQIQTYVPVLDGAIRSLGTGQVDPTLQQAAAVIPYGSLALAVIGVVFGVIKHVQAGNLTDQEAQSQKAFEQIVSALDAALPVPTPEQKAAVDAVLDTDVKAKVAAVRS